ncbi:nucleotidyl transferase AbiEii/AbiGii toxin family protein [uncultured Duncaniella sp.]|uniref:nucleotidyl transferase AbiEii/AbiGii toxin family protein n=1 Tax=uncultured Duncaniella sp. TaxID=2768039 RepID=UPI002736EA82|nr:nucleotidyl transferase AbiEii/AbiGii toxin family protein [uncultured Duncaniella sp.]
MKLHENKEQLADAIRITSAELGIPQKFVEKDYWICQILQRLSRMPQAERTVWKGGTSLTKGYGIIQRFSSDVDLAIIGEGLSNNQQKKLVLHLGKDTTIDLEETEEFGESIKNSRFRKTYHSYPSVIDRTDTSLDFLGNYVIVEINTYGNPYPFVRQFVKPFITEMMEKRQLEGLIAQLDMAPFELNVLDKRRTMCEKVVSLLRFSFEEDPVAGLTSKVRHFYDLHFLMKDKECHEYLDSSFPVEIRELVAHDKAEFDRPPLWKTSEVLHSPLLTSFSEMWKRIAPVYQSEVGALSFGELPKPEEVSQSMDSLIRIVQKALC